jgi:hypothetical protein
MRAFGQRILCLSLCSGWNKIRIKPVEGPALSLSKGPP